MASNEQPAVSADAGNRREFDHESDDRCLHGITLPTGSNWALNHDLSLPVLRLAGPDPAVDHTVLAADSL